MLESSIFFSISRYIPHLAGVGRGNLMFFEKLRIIWRNLILRSILLQGNENNLFAQMEIEPATAVLTVDVVPSCYDSLS